MGLAANVVSQTLEALSLFFASVVPFYFNAFHNPGLETEYTLLHIQLHSGLA